VFPVRYGLNLYILFRRNSVVKPFQRHIRINSYHMHYPHKKDERALPGNLQNRRYFVTIDGVRIDEWIY
jgi:hypothetical protein